MKPPARPEPAQSIPIRPIIINQPIVERTYSEGYRERIVERPGSDTEPLPAFVPPPMEQIQPSVIHVHVASPTSPSERIIIHEPVRSPERDTQKERTKSGHPPVETRPQTPDARVPHVEVSPVPDRSAETVDPNKKSSVAPTKTIPNNSPDRIDSELFEPDKPAPQANVPTIKKVGKVGRQRKYEELGMDDVEPVKEVVLFRHLMGRHWPGLSKDMESYYERLYFSRPKKGSKDYDKHKGCWERKQRWVTEHTSPVASV